MIATFDIGNGDRGKGEVIKQNAKTILVRLVSGKIIKRHREKHNVELKKGKK